MSETRELVEHFFRHESGRLIALLTKSLGVRRLDLAEDVVCSSLMQALQVWSRQGIPDDPAGWLYRAARNLALDTIRREKTYARIVPSRFDECESSSLLPLFAEEIGDEPLRLLFLCCHETIPRESQIALALRTVCGFSTSEIARGLLTSEANVQKRIVRAKERLRDEPEAWEAPGLEPLRGRREAVLSAISWEHCRAPTFAETDWNRIIALYEALERIESSPVFVLNRCVALAYRDGPEAALTCLLAVPSHQIPSRYPIWSAVLGELSFRSGNIADAERFWNQAMEITHDRAGQDFLKNRLAACRAGASLNNASG